MCVFMIWSMAWPHLCRWHCMPGKSTWIKAKRQSTLHKWERLTPCREALHVERIGVLKVHALYLPWTSKLLSTADIKKVSTTLIEHSMPSVLGWQQGHSGSGKWWCHQSQLNLVELGAVTNVVWDCIVVFCLIIQQPSLSYPWSMFPKPFLNGYVRRLTHWCISGLWQSYVRGEESLLNVVGLYYAWTYLMYIVMEKVKCLMCL